MTTYLEVNAAWQAYNAAAAKYGRAQLAWEQVRQRCGATDAAVMVHFNAAKQARTPPALSPEAEAMAAACLRYLAEGAAAMAASPGNGAFHDPGTSAQQQAAEATPQAASGNGGGHEEGKPSGASREGEEKQPGEGEGEEGKKFDDLLEMAGALKEGDRNEARAILRTAVQMEFAGEAAGDDLEWLLEVIKDKTKIRLGELRSTLRQAKKKAAEEAALEMADRLAQGEMAQAEQAEAEKAALRELRKERVAPLAKDPKLFDRVMAAARSLGAVREEVAIKATYLTTTSRLLMKRVISLLRRGTAASGKNYLFDIVLVLIPPESVERITGSSAKALVYFGGSEDPGYLAYKIVYIPEASSLLAADGKEHEMAGMLRSLISENEINYPMVVLREGGLSPITIRIVKKGPIAVLVTSARDNIEPEMLTRLAFADADESIEQNSLVMTAHFDAAAAVGGLTDDEKAEIDLLVEFQRCLQDEGPYDVIVPFAAKIRAAFSKTPRAVRIRRDIGTLIAGVAASAVMHKAQRDTDEQGRIIATLDDYGHAIDAFGPGVGIFHNPRQSPGVIALVRVLEKLIEKEKERCVDPELFDGAATAPRRLLAKELGLSSQKTVAARLEAARDGNAIGCLNDDAGAGVARRYRVLISSAEMDKAREGDGANSVFPSRALVKQMIDDQAAFKAALAVIREELAQEPGHKPDPAKPDPEGPKDYEQEGSDDFEVPF